MERFKKCKPDVLIMHPGPINRGVEIASCLLYTSPQSRGPSWKQEEAPPRPAPAPESGFAENSSIHPQAKNSIRYDEVHRDELAGYRGMEIRIVM